MTSETEPKGWKWATLGAVADFVNGDRGENYPTQSDRVGAGVPFINTGHIEPSGRLTSAGMDYITRDSFERLRGGKVKPGDIVYCLRGSTIGKAARNHLAEGAIASSLVIIRAKAQACQEYLYFYLTSPLGKQLVAQHDNGSAQPNLSVRSLSNYPLPLPPVDEQRAIAHILGTLDDKIELNRRMNETLEAMARAIFKSWFVDFDPVRAKAEGRDPGLPKHIADLFPGGFENSELGEIPAGWEIRKLSHLCSTQYGYTASATDEPIGPKFLRVTDINKQNWIDWGDVPHCAIDPNARAAYALQVGDLVVARMADPGKSAIIEEQIDAVFASYLVRLKIESLANSYYVHGFLKSRLYSEYADGTKSGSVQPNMNAQVIVGASLVVPPTRVIEQFFGAIHPLRQRLVANVHEARNLAALRDALLPKLVSGELRVNDRERFFEGVSS